MDDPGDEREVKRGRPVLDYLFFLAWSAPAVLAATFAQILLVPKMKKLIEDAQTDSDTMEDVGKIVSALPEILFVVSGAILILVAVLIVILEVAAKGWPRYRRTCLMIVAWLVNSATLIGLCLLATCILMFAMT